MIGTSPNTYVQQYFNLTAQNAPTAAFINQLPTCIGQAAAGLLPILSAVQINRVPQAPPQQQAVVIFNLFPLELNPFVPPALKPTVARDIGTVNTRLAEV